MPEAPSIHNDFLASHAALLIRNHLQLTGRRLIEGPDDPVEQARRLFEAPFFVASHNAADDPVLTYGNRCALDLFEMNWEAFVSTPSRFTAEAPNRAERARLLEQVRTKGFIDDYSGIRISSTGKRFRIQKATVWNLLDDAGHRVGQAASFSHWDPVES